MMFVISLVLVTSAWGMVDFDDEDNWPWSQTTNLGPDADVPGFFINLGITGARAKITEANLRALEVAYVFSNTPAYGKLQVGDLIVGANGKAFETDHKNGYGMAVFGGEGPCMDWNLVEMFVCELIQGPQADEIMPVKTSLVFLSDRADFRIHQICGEERILGIILHLDNIPHLEQINNFGVFPDQDTDG